MKKFFSVLLTVTILLTAVFCPIGEAFKVFAAPTSIQSDVVLENTFDEDGWNPQQNSNLLKEPIADGSNGNALRFNKVTSITATTGNNIRHYKIYDPEKIYGGYMDYKPSANTTYKLTFRYRTRSLLTDNNIYINVRGVANDTVSDVLCRAVTVKKTLKLTTDSDYKWDTAIAYFTTPEDVLDALAISVEYNGTQDSTGAFNVAIDDVKLETAPDSFVVANTFEEDDVYSFGINDSNANGTINSGEDPGVCIDTTNTSKNVNLTAYSDTSLFGSANAVTARTNSTLGFRALRLASHSAKAHYEIYDYSKGIVDNKLQSFVPEVGENYQITFEYKLRVYSANILFTIRPVTVVDGKRILGEPIATAFYIPSGDTDHKSASTWKTASVNVPITQAVDGLALTMETNSASGATNYMYIDNIVVHKYDSDIIENNYEETILGKASTATAMANTKITGNSLLYLGTKATAAPNTSRVLQFNGFTGQTSIAGGDYAYVEIYNPYDVNFAGFVPEEDAYYKLSFDYKTRCSTSSATFNINIRGKTGTTIGENIVTAVSMPAKDSEYTEDKWRYASVIFSTAGKSYETLAITVESSAGNVTTIYPFFDNIRLEKIEDVNAETSFTVHHGSAYGKDEETVVRTNSTLLSDMTFEDTDYAKFEGLYFDSEYTIPAVGPAYGETDVYAKWSNLHILANTYEESAITTKDKLNGEALTYVGPRASAGPTRLLQLNNVYGLNHYNQGRISHLEIYDPNHEDFETSEKVPSFKPLINSVYKISIEYKIKASNLGDVSINIRGKKDGKLGEVLGTLNVIKSGDPNYTESIWCKSEAYIYTQGVEYDALAVTFEANSLLTTNLWPYVDNIEVERMTEYESGVINRVAHARKNTNGLMAINNGKWFEMNKGDFAKLSFKLNADSVLYNSRVAVTVIAENGDTWDVTLFEVSAQSHNKTYYTTFNAPISGKVVVSVYKNDFTPIDKEIVISDLTIDAFTPSIMKGDANIDNEIDILDLVRLKQNVDPKKVALNDYLINSDLNKSGDISLDDLSILRKKMLDTFTLGSLDVGIEYEFDNETQGSAAGKITLTSHEDVDNFVDIYWGANGKPIDTYYYIGSTELNCGQTANFKLDSHLAIPNGATQIIVNDGLATKAFDITKRYDASFTTDIIKLVKDYTAKENIANVKIVYDSSLASQAYINGVSEKYDMICEFRNKLSDAIGAKVELISDSISLNENQNYIVVGDTRFSMSDTVLESVTNIGEKHHSDFAIKADGKQIYINAPNDYALQFAFDYFIDTYCANGVTNINNDLDYLSSNVVGDITLADVSINNFNIVYPKLATVLEVDAAKYLAANIVKATGMAPISIVNDTAAVNDYEILIGHTNRTDADTYAVTADAAADNSYTITVESNRTIITGGTNSAVNAAVVDFTNKLLTGSLATGTYTGKYDGSFSLTNGFKLTWSDEFNGTALSNTWEQLELDYSTIDEGKVVWDTNNATVENGALKATVSKIADSNDTSGLSLDTDTNKLIRYGYFETRIKSFDQEGYMNGFWGSTIGEVANYIDGLPGTYYGEFDILEMYEEMNVIKPNLHNHCVGEASSINYLQGDSVLFKPQKTVDDMGSKYHTFAMQWTDDYIYFYLDGIKYYSFDCTRSPEYNVFDMVTRIRLTFSAGKYVTPAAESDEAFVDWVRVWQKNEAGYVVK